jgi:hypothetical protein
LAYPPTFTFVAGPKTGDKGTIELEQVSNRGIGMRTVTYTVASPKFGGTITYDSSGQFLVEKATYHITVNVVLLIDDKSSNLTAAPDGASSFSYDVHNTGGNPGKPVIGDCNRCPVDPPCTNHGQGVLNDPTTFKQGKEGLIKVTGALGDPALQLQIAVLTTCGKEAPSYSLLTCGGDGLKATLHGDSTYRIDVRCNANQSRPGVVKWAKAHISGTLAPLDASAPAP